jgi:hypothetical protein
MRQIILKGNILNSVGISWSFSVLDGGYNLKNSSEYELAQLCQD